VTTDSEAWTSVETDGLLLLQPTVFAGGAAAGRKWSREAVVQLVDQMRRITDISASSS
jgi:hypothetical protein